MRKVSELAQKLMAKLVSWEVLGAKENPKLLLRETPFVDLSIISANVREEGQPLKNFIAVPMIETELLYRTGLLEEDWTFFQDGNNVVMTYKPVSFPVASVHMHTRVPVGAEA